MATGTRSSPSVRVLALLAGLAGAALLCLCARGDLWFDELWSLQRTLRLEHWHDVLLGPEFQHDNNHWTTTWWLHALGPGASPLAQRAPAVAAGILTLAALAWLGGRTSSAAGALAVALGAGSFLLVQYGSEARGYSGAVLCGLLAFGLLAGSGERAGLRALAFFGTVLLGTASHLTFLYVYLALLFWHPVRLWRSGGPAFARKRLLQFHLAPLLVLAVLYLTVLRHLVIGGGPKLATLEVVRDTLGLLLGLPAGSPWAFAGLVAAVGVVALELGLRLRARDDSALFFLAVLLVVPAATLALREAKVLYVRYFLVCVPFLLLLAASLLARLAGRGPAGRSVAALVLLGALAANAAPIAALARLGRGQYSAAAHQLATESPAGPIEIAVPGWHAEILLRHHAARIAPGREFVCLLPDASPSRPPLWILVDRLEPDAVPEPELAGAFGRRYALAGSFRYAGLSGQCWFLYRRNSG